MVTEQAPHVSLPPRSHTDAPLPPGRGARKVFIVGVLGLSALLAIGILPKLRQKAERDAAESAVGRPRQVTYAVAKLGDSQGQLILPGTAAAIETATIYARTNGFVRELKADIGDRVKAGDVLAILDTPETESDAASAKAKANETALNEKISRATAERYRHLSEAGISSREQAEEAEARANSAQAALSTSHADLSRWNTLLGFRYVRAPFAGIVTKRNVEKGSLVTAGSASGVASLYEIARTETLKIQVEVPQSLAQSIAVGDSAQVLSGGRSVTGAIARTSGALDPSTRTLRTEIHISGDQGILAGSFVRVALSTRAASPPVHVPANALVSRPGGNFVFVVNEQSAVVPAQVTLGRELGAEVELVAGLKDGERVVTNPPESLAEGEVVGLIERKAEAKPSADAGAAVTPPGSAGDKIRAAP